MKRYVLIMSIVLTFLFGGPQSLLCQEGRGNAVPADMLQTELRDLDIKDYFISSDAEEVGFVRTLAGHIVVRHGDSGEAYFAAAGDKLFEKDTIFTLEKSRCRLKFVDDNVVTLGEKAMITIKEFDANLKLKEKKSVYKVTRGKAMFYALKMLRYRKASMSVETPTAVAGVRGTKFGVEVKEMKDKSAALRPVYLADASETGWVRLAQSAPEGYISATIVYNFDGTVTVTSTATGQSVTLLPGQMINMFITGPGNVVFIPPSVWQQFLNDTSPNGGGGGGSGGGGSGGGNGGNGDGDGDGDGGTGGDNTDVTQNQTTTGAETPTDTETDPDDNKTGTKVGYFSGMLTNQTGSSLEEIFVSTKRQNFNAANIWARGSKDTSKDYLRADPNDSFDTPPYAKWAVFDSGTKSSVDLGTNNPISHTELGSNANLEWGYWTMPDTFTVDDTVYLVDNRGYYIFGDDTSSMPTTGSAAYSGDAYGTYWSSGTGTNMTGSFSCNVNFVTNAISAFTMSVLSSNEETSASITGASGSFASDSTFNISNGTWSLNGTTPDHKMCYGSFYGSAADSIGGAWGMYYDASNIGATGIFQGDKGSIAPSTHYGYMTGMLEHSSGTRTYATTYISDILTDFDATSVKVAEAGRVVATYYIKLDGTASPRTLDEWTRYTATADITWSGTQAISRTETSHSEYMEWGYWTQADGMVGSDSETYYFANRGYYVWGDNTAAGSMPQTGSYTYSGNAYGTFWTAGGGSNMTGTFSSDVNFQTGQISNFDMSVEGSSYSASIEDATGSISSSEFSLNGGTWELGGMNADTKSGHGSFYGPDAAAMGGVWQMGYGGGSYQATGSFVSDTKTTLVD